MKVKKYVAKSMPEAMKMIRAELGNDAVILNSKVVQKRGVFGFFAKKSIEVIAAVDSKPVIQKETKPKPPPVRKEVSREDASPVIKHQTPKVQENNMNDKAVLQELKELKTIISTLSGSTNYSSNVLDQYPEPLRQINSLLTEQEIEVTIRQNIINQLLEKWYVTGGQATVEQVKQWTANIIDTEVSSHHYGGIRYKKKYVNVVGPTGVGKTTTLAKIAAECVLRDQKKVAFITTDTYRIAAVDQLKTYAKILGIPLEICYNNEDFILAKNKFQHYDLILIDTAGRNYRNQQYVEDLKEILNFNEDMETYLVLSLSSRYEDMKAIIEQFSLITIDQLIFTKVDETTKYGPMLNMMIQYNKGIAYVTNGQNVPDDIMAASPSVITKTILGVDVYE
ncbi:flagellar biosynthesis protein FlhF [Bacillus sp. HMF5848]|uniref:flagellar biosynthesis protein FlhF n=1 Tax=Bacillus sp. HMF5848 TaxID=2495421 RepID=UPI000F7810D5|nr:flagellar biosynthesis protein FlhF [Bacillus sp. HMF5848]RSK27044.1 flagellar biosynthesis protein FlhF [Bacillus sp. HMF5848]